jgi:RNA polymerase sigma factor (sigma-70 family)
MEYAFMPRSSSSAPHMMSPSDATTVQLLARIRHGDASALDILFARYVPRLRRWMHGRLPRWVRIDADTGDMVQDVMLRSVGRLHALEPRCRHALAAYFRTAIRNRIRDEHRRFVRRGGRAVPSDWSDLTAIDPSQSPLDRLLDDEVHAKYLTALARLDRTDRELVVGHVELDYTHAQLGCMTDRTPNAARMALRRAIDRLAAHMRDDD